MGTLLGVHPIVPWNKHRKLKQITVWRSSGEECVSATSRTYPLGFTNIAGWNIPIFNRKYIFNPGPFSIAMLDYPRVYFEALKAPKVENLKSNQDVPIPHPTKNWLKTLSDTSLHWLTSLQHAHIPSTGGFSYGTNPNNASTLLMKLPQNSPEIYIDGTSQNGKFVEIPAEFQGDRWPNFCFHILYPMLRVSVSPPGLLCVHWFFPPLFHGSTPEALQRHVFFCAFAAENPYGSSLLPKSN